MPKTASYRESSALIAISGARSELHFFSSALEKPDHRLKIYGRCFRYEMKISLKLKYIYFRTINVASDRLCARKPQVLKNTSPEFLFMFSCPS